MKTTILVLLSLFYSFQLGYKKTFIKKFAIGIHTFSIYKTEQYSHDDNWNAYYFTIFKAGENKRLASAYMEAKRNDSIFIKGRYTIYRNKIEFVEDYFYKRNLYSIDSVKKIFYPNQNGELILKETIEFKNGKSTTNFN